MMGMEKTWWGWRGHGEQVVVVVGTWWGQQGLWEHLGDGGNSGDGGNGGDMVGTQ